MDQSTSLNLQSEDKNSTAVGCKNLSIECLDKWNVDGAKNKYRLFWEGNFCDSNTYDYGEVTSDTLMILVKKCANIFVELGLGVSGSVLLYLPNILQLPVAALAAIRIGASFIPYSAANEDIEDLKNVILKGNTNIIVTVDGFWRGKRLVRTKWILDEAVQQINMKIKHILVIRHTTPNDGVPPPPKETLGRRPYYAYKIEMQDGRDSWWANHFVNATNHEAATDNQSGIMKQPIWINESLSLQQLRSNDVYDHVNKLAKLVKSEGICFVASYSDASLSVIAALSVLFSGSQLLIAKKLIIPEKDLLALIDHPEYLRMWNTKFLENIIIIGSDRYIKTMATIFDVPCINLIC
uniref:AMP-binding domain-containing protein n=1 Tax=Syphacia muris TaxID=451379 RepID=A0A0N5AAB8_9BILA